MYSFKLGFAVGALGVALVVGGPANSTTIDYVFSGTFTGSLGNSTFTDQSFAVTLSGDTGAVTSGGGELSNIATSATFTIGASTGSLTGNYNDVVLNPAFLGGTVIFGQSQPSSPFFVAEGLSAATLGSYGLATALALTSGPVSQTPGSTYFTSLGNLVFTDISSLSFEAELAATPLPAALPLFATVLGAAGGLLAGRRKRRTETGLDAIARA